MASRVEGEVFPKDMIRRPFSEIIEGRSALRWSYFFLLMTATMVPSLETHGILNLKSISFLLSAFAFFYALLFNPRISQPLQKVSAWFLSGFLFILVWFSLGLDWMPYVTDQAKLFFITFWAIFLSFFLIYQKVVSRQEVICALIYLSLIYSLGKLLLAFFMVVKIWDPIGVSEKLGIRLVTFSIVGSLRRLQTSCDLFSPYLIFFALMKGPLELQLSKKMRVFFILAAWISIILSFSRYLMAVAALSHILYAFSSSLSKWGKTAGLSLAMGAMVLLGAGPERVATYIEKRFSSEASYRSDEVRLLQSEALMELFETAPLLGQGLGAHSEKVVRDPFRKHSYEVQWLSFLMQLGIVGLLFIGAALGSAMLFILRPPMNRSKLALFLLFLIWLISGFTNPFLISLASGLIYALFLIAGDILHNRDEKKEEIYG